MFRFAPVVLCLTLLLPFRAGAEVRVLAPGLDPQVVTALTAASLLVQTDALDGATGQDLVAAAQADYARLVGVLYQYGYFAPIVTIRLNGREAADLSAFSAPTRITAAELRVQAGPAFRFGRAAIAPLAPGTILPDGFRPGAPATTPVLRQTVEAGIDGWRKAGHATADLGGQDLIADHRRARLEADLRLRPGPQVTFGRIRPSGTTRIAPDRLAEIAGLPAGALFDPALVAGVEERLRRTGVFRSIDVREGTPDADDVMDLAVQVEDAPLRRVGIGGELSSTEGLRFSSYWLHRNITGAGDRLRFEGEVSGIGGLTGGLDAMLSARYSRPATFGPDTTFRAGVTLDHLDEVTSVQDSITFDTALDHVFSDTLSGSLGLSLSWSDIDDAFGRYDVTLLSLPASLTWDRRDDPFNAATGWYTGLSVEPFTTDWGGDLGYRATLDARTYLSLGDTVLAGRAQLGSLQGGSLGALPPDMLFYSGGSGTVRGQQYQSLGAVQGGVATGGRGFIGLSGEIRQPLFGDVSAVAFVDAGYISAGSLYDASGQWHSGAGVGIRYDTGIGPIRVDLATPLSGTGKRDKLQIYIGIGQAF